MAGKLFEDEDFPPTMESILDSGDTSLSLPRPEWRRLSDCRKRPVRMLPDPQVTDMAANDVKPGLVDDRWLLDALFALQSHNRVLEHIFFNHEHIDQARMPLLVIQQISATAHDSVCTPRVELLYCSTGGPLTVCCSWRAELFGCCRGCMC